MSDLRHSLLTMLVVLPSVLLWHAVGFAAFGLYWLVIVLIAWALIKREDRHRGIAR